jgi:hypothetical protein
MANRIPSSLNWLIDKRARIAGEIDKTKRSLHKAQKLIDELKDLEIKLTAIDTALDLHAVKIDVSLIKPITSKYVKINIPHGELTRSILNCIRTHQQNGPVSTLLIINYVITNHFDANSNIIPRNLVAKSIHNRIKNLCRNGTIERCHDIKSNQYGLWKISEKFDFD